MADIFDALLNLEEDAIERGRQEGQVAGLVEGKEEGLNVGFEQGFDVGRELGQYLGSIQTWLDLAEKYPNTVSERTKKSLLATKALLDSFIFDPDREMMYDVDIIRNKYKVLSSQLGVVLTATDDKNLSF